ncbi:hypothetical protein KQX54_015749, partial [Cotesia glomerata]
MNIQLVTAVFYCTIYLNGFFSVASPIVKVKNGTLEGSLMKTRRGREFLSFRGISYALPPIGDLRFE